MEAELALSFKVTVQAAHNLVKNHLQRRDFLFWISVCQGVCSFKCFRTALCHCVFSGGMEESVFLMRLSLYLRLSPILFSLAIAEIWARAFVPPVEKRDSLPRKGREADRHATFLLLSSRAWGQLSSRHCPMSQTTFQPRTISPNPIDLMGKGCSPPSLASCFCTCDVHGSYQNGSLFHFCPTLLVKSKNNNNKKPLRVGNKDDLLLLKRCAAQIELCLKCACLPLVICLFIASLLRGRCDLNLLLQVPLWGTTDTVLLVDKKLVSFFSVLVFLCFHLFGPIEVPSRLSAPAGLGDGDGLGDVSQLPSLSVLESGKSLPGWLSDSDSGPVLLWKPCCKHAWVEVL